MKVIRPNDIKIEEFSQSNHSKTTLKEAIRDLVNIKDEHIQYTKAEHDQELIKCDMHPFVEAVHLAYSDHLPLVITPDSIWYLISSGVAIHINKHSEELRKKFVDHEGKKTIKVRRDDFRLNESNPWNEVIDEFCEKINENTKNEIADKLVANFTTTTKDARVVSQLVLMDAMQKYFDYRFSTLCGIPEIKIAGEKRDWENIKEKTKSLVDLIPDLSIWIKHLDEILQNFIDVFDEKVNKQFWNEIYKVGGGSGGPYISGWIIALFPYLDENVQNNYVWNKSWRSIKEGDFFAGLTTSSFSYHMNQVPFIWEYFGTEIKMLFVGGLVGVLYEKSNGLKPVFGYAVTENKVITDPRQNIETEEA